jgi:hypothetical protein
VIFMTEYSLPVGPGSCRVVRCHPSSKCRTSTCVKYLGDKARESARFRVPWALMPHQPLAHNLAHTSCSRRQGAIVKCFPPSMLLR